MVVRGTARTGEPVRPVTVHVTVQPSKWEIEIRAWKEGFTEQSLKRTLPWACATVSGKVIGGGIWEQGIRSGPVAHAHVECRRLVDGGYEGWPLDAFTDDSGAFSVPVQGVKRYHLDAPEYHLPDEIDMDLNEVVLQSLHVYALTLDDFRQGALRGSRPGIRAGCQRL